MVFGETQTPQGSQEKSLEDQLRKLNADSDITDEIMDTAKASDFELEGYDETKTVTAIAEQQLLKDVEIADYMQDPEYATIVGNVVTEMTSDSGKMRTFQEGLNATDAKEEYVDQATKQLTADMKEKIQQKIMDSISSNEGNA